MKCVICKHGETQAGQTTVTLDRNDVTLVIRHVPAEVCRVCGEAYFTEDVTQCLWDVAEQASRAGAHIDIREYAACQPQPHAA